MNERNVCSEEFSQAFQEYARLKEIYNKIDELNLMVSKSISETQWKDEKIKELGNEVREIKARLSDTKCESGNLGTLKNERRIIPMEEPRRKDEWFSVIRDAVNEYEAECGYTPDQVKLWTYLIEHPLAVYGVGYDKPNKALTLSDGSSLDRPSFNGRFGRYYRYNKT